MLYLFWTSLNIDLVTLTLDRSICGLLILVPALLESESVSELLGEADDVLSVPLQRGNCMSESSSSESSSKLSELELEQEKRFQCSNSACNVR